MRGSLDSGAWRIFGLLALFQPLFLGFFWLRLPPRVPLFFSRPWGEAQLATPAFLILLPGLTILVGLTNLVATRFLVVDQTVIRILSWATAIFAILSTVALIRIVFLAT